MNSQTFAPPPSVPAIYQQNLQAEQTAEWNAILTKIVQLDSSEKEGALEMGDLFCRVEDRWGKAQVKTAASTAGIEYNMARQRAWVSRKIPSGSPLRSEPGLSYSHLRAMAALPEAEMEEWANRALSEAWSSHRLRAEIDGAGAGQDAPAAEPPKLSAEERALCGACGDAVDGESAAEVVYWRQGVQHGACCNALCASEFFHAVI